VILLLLALTAPNGLPVHVEPEAVEVVRQTPECVGAEVRVSTGNLCVKESVEEVLKLLKETEGDDD
jgi:uncharacterized protein YlzI (FlbEa/FlbD family)